MTAIAEILKSLTGAMASYGFGSASVFGAHQPEEPDQ